MAEYDHESIDGTVWNTEGVKAGQDTNGNVILARSLVGGEFLSIHLLDFPMATNLSPPITWPLLPSYVKHPPEHIGREDVEYLQRKGALSVPDLELRDALLRAFIEFVHPCLPILDLHSFQASIQDPVQHGQLSLPLFQAIMFAGSAWVDIKLLRGLGFLTRKAARKCFYQKARLLYDSDYEQDRYCLVQTLLLLSFWWEGPNEQKDGWYWSGLSLLVCRTIGLNQDSTSQSMDPRMQGLRRQLWWSCLVRDTIASFGLERQPRVEDSEFDVATLTMEDFDIQERRSEETRWSVAKDAARQRQLAVVFMEMVKLCRILSKVLKAAYSEDPAGHIGTIYLHQEFNDNIEKTPGRRTIDAQKLSLCENELRKWRQEVPEQAFHAHPTPSPAEPYEQAPYLHRAMLSLLYFTALLSLHRPRTQSNERETRENARLGVRHAAAQCNEIVMDLHRADLMRVLPATSISCLIPVAISHLHDMKSPDDSIRREGQRRLEECKQALRELADTHVAAERAINFLSFLTSLIKGKSARKVAGMMSGEIRWNTYRPPSDSELPMSFAPAIYGDQPDHDSDSDLLPVGMANQSGQYADLGDSSFAIHSVQGFESTTTAAKPASDSGLSSDIFANMIDFPQMWLDMAGVSNSTLDMDWTNETQTPSIAE